MFPIFLFAVVFSFYCWLYESQQMSCQQQCSEILTLDIVTGLVPLMPRTKMPSVSPGQLSLFDCKSKPLPLLPDPWALPIDEIASVTVQPQQTAQTQHKPVLLLPPVKEASIQPLLPTAAEPTLEQFLSRINIDNLQLRPARKIAKALNIAQKIHGRDQTLSFLRNQIKVKLQQLEALSVETREVLGEVLTS